jgi:glycine cleavage system H protein
MILLPEHLKYAASHEWSQLEANNMVRIGITDFAQSELGDVMYVNLPEVGRTVCVGEQIAVVESVKTASDLFAPVSGTIVAVNEAVTDAPELINDDAYGTWLFIIEAHDPSQLDRMMSAAGYQQMIDE